jgi:hypothetical protein
MLMGRWVGQELQEPESGVRNRRAGTRSGGLECEVALDIRVRRKLRPTRKPRIQAILQLLNSSNSFPSPRSPSRKNVRRNGQHKYQADESIALKESLIDARDVQLSRGAVFVNQCP